MLKFFSKNFTKKYEIFLQSVCTWFPQEVVPLSNMNSQAVNIVEVTLKGKIMLLNNDVLEAVKHMLKNHVTVKKKQKRVSNGGENIVFGPPKGIKSWNGMEKGKKIIALHNALKPKAQKYFQYKMSCLFSSLSTNNPGGVPQTAHSDYTAEHVEKTFEKLSVKPLFAFTPLHEDGSMLIIWTEEYTKWQKKPKGHTGKYLSVHSLWKLLILPGDLVHSGGFCFGNVFESADTPKSILGFKNHCLHFFLCPDKDSRTQANSDVNEIIYEDEDKEVLQSAGEFKNNELDDSNASLTILNTL